MDSSHGGSLWRTMVAGGAGAAIALLATFGFSTFQWYRDQHLAELDATAQKSLKAYQVVRRLGDFPGELRDAQSSDDHMIKAMHSGFRHDKLAMERELRASDPMDRSKTQAVRRRHREDIEKLSLILYEVGYTDRDQRPLAALNRYVGTSTDFMAAQGRAAFPQPEDDRKKLAQVEEDAGRTYRAAYSGLEQEINALCERSLDRVHDFKNPLYIRAAPYVAGYAIIVFALPAAWGRLRRRRKVGEPDRGSLPHCW